MSEPTGDPTSREGSEPSVAEMREHWSNFAREDAMFYIATNRRGWDRAEFYEDGRALAESTMDWAGEVESARMLEVGCGAGRMLVHFADRFDEVVGVDIAPEMIEAARAGNLRANVTLLVTSGADLGPLDDNAFSFVFSALVFQHIPTREIVGSYVDEIARVLTPGGKAVLQFDTRPRDLRRSFVLRLPDRLLPRTRRRFIRRYPVPRDWLAARLASAGLEVRDEQGPGTGNHRVLCVKPADRIERRPGPS